MPLTPRTILARLLYVGFSYLFLATTLAATQSPTDSDWDTGNLVANGDFARGQIGALPAGWTTVSPNPALAPEFKLASHNGRPALMATGNDRRECFGWVRHSVQVSGGKNYRFRVRLRAEGLEDLNRHLVHGVFGSFNDGIFNYRKEGDTIIGDGRFPGPAQAGKAEVRFYFRYSPKGKVWWEKVSLQECDPIPPRLVKVACNWGGGDMAHWNRWLDLAGEKKVDLALLPEMFNGKSPKQAEPLDGPAAAFLAQKAKQWRMYVTGTFYERRGDVVFNTAPLFDRAGKLVGTYEKTEVYEPEEDDGVTPGTNFPVFDTDFGKVGIIICYDSWFPETTRLLAYKGAELVLLPNAGYFRGLMAARAADNAVWMAVSTLGSPAGIWDSGGTMAGEKEPEPTRYATSSIRGFEQDDQARMLIATLDLSRRYSPHWWGGPMLSAPGGRRARQTAIESLEDQIALEAKRWWTVEPSKAQPAPHDAPKK